MRVLFLVVFGLFLQACSSSKPSLQAQYKPEHVKAKIARDYLKNQIKFVGREYVITSQGKTASIAGKKMYDLGGNIIDAALAISFAISVERPQSTGIGGGGFMLLHLAKEGRTFAIDFREKAPLRATKDMYLDENQEPVQDLSLNGPLSIGTPGLVAGLLEIHQKYGRLSLEKILQPAIELAENGFSIYERLAWSIEKRKDVLRRYPATRKIFFNDDWTPLQEGDLLVQRDLAKTLRTIAKRGKNGFYEGWVARAIVNHLQKHGGMITKHDLDHYNVKWREPVQGKYRGLKVVSMPPPSSGGTHIIQMLNVLDNVDLATLGPYHPHSIHYTVSAMQRAYLDRARYLGDSDFVSVPLDKLLGNDYADQIYAEIDPQYAKASKKLSTEKNVPVLKESSETTHFTIMDKYGNVVSSTQTINYLFGSGMVVPGTGIILNNEMDDFSAKPGSLNVYGAVGSLNNAIESEKRPLSSMSPTILFRQNKPVLALGSPGGTRIITCVLNTILNATTYKMPLYDSILSLRFHHQFIPDIIQVEEPGFPKNLHQELLNRGYSVRTKNIPCRLNAIQRVGEKLVGVVDPRGEGFSTGE